MKDTTATVERRAGLPGLALRPYRGESDLPTIVEIINRQLEADGVPFREDVGHLGSWYLAPSAHFDPLRDCTIAEVRGLTGSILGRRVEVRRSGAPGARRLIVGDQSRIELD